MTGSIVEYLVYCAAVTLLMAYSMQFLVITHQQLSKQEKGMQNALQGLVVQTMLHRDVMQAHPAADRWHARDATGLIWTIDEQTHIGWFIEKNNLMKVQGMYDFDQHRWISSNKTMVAQHVEQFSLRPEFSADNKQCVRCSCALKFTAAAPFQWTVSLRNREVA